MKPIPVFWQALAAADALTNERQTAFAKSVDVSKERLSRIKRGHLAPTPEEQIKIFKRFDELGIPINQCDRNAAFFSAPVFAATPFKKTMAPSTVQKHVEDARVDQRVIEVLERLAADPDTSEPARVELATKVVALRHARGLDRIQF